MERAGESWLLARDLALVLLERNYRVRSGEIDLIFERRSRPPSRGGAGTGGGTGVLEVELVFVEIRGRGPGSWTNGLESIDLRKRRRLKKAIACYLVNYRGCARSARVDVLSWDGERFSHAEDVWL